MFRTNGKNEHLDEKNFHYNYRNFFDSAVLRVTWSQLCSKFFLNNYEAHWQWHLIHALQLKILRKWINIRAYSFLIKRHETKIDKDARKIISCMKNQVYTLKNIAPNREDDISFTILLLFLSNTPSFQI